MFLSKFFSKKDHKHYLTQAGKHLAAERYADARIDFQEALKLCPADAKQDEQEIRAGLGRACNQLGEMNLQEGEHMLQAGDLSKAQVHFDLACELALDETIRKMARAGLAKLQRQEVAQAAAPAAARAAAPAAQAAAPAAAPVVARAAAPVAAPAVYGKTHGGSSCASCSDKGSHHAAAEPIPEMNLSDEDRFSLLIQPLGELSTRYAALGKEFARAYLLIQDGNDKEAFPILQQMLVSGDNDIVIYELALIMYRSGRLHESEVFLNRAIQANPRNPMCFLALVHLVGESNRFADALMIVKHMLEQDIIADQAQFMLGELYEVTGEEAAAFEAYTKALELPTVARAAAERLVPMLSNQGREEEATYLAKRYLKGCC